MGSEFAMNRLNPGIRESRCCCMLKASTGCTGIRSSGAAVLAPKVAERPTETEIQGDSENPTRPVLYTTSRDVTFFFISDFFLFIHN